MKLKVCFIYSVLYLSFYLAENLCAAAKSALYAKRLTKRKKRLGGDFAVCSLG